MATLSSLWTPTVWNDAYLEASLLSNNLINSGIVSVNDSLLSQIMNEKGYSVNIPAVTVGETDAQIPTNTDTLASVTAVSSAIQIALYHRRTKTWREGDLAQEIAGEDAIGAIMSRTAKYWVGQAQARLIASLTGIFADNRGADSSSLIHKIAVEVVADQEATTKMSLQAIIDGTALLGDNMGDIAGVIMHPTVYAYYAGLRDTTISMDVNGNRVDNALGMTILIDSNCPKRAGTTSGFVYSTYLFKKGAIIGKELPSTMDFPQIEIERNPLMGTGSGATTLVTRNNMILHPNGFTFDGSPVGLSATDTELETAGNWDRVSDVKNTGIILLETN